MSKKLPLTVGCRVVVLPTDQRPMLHGKEGSVIKMHPRTMVGFDIGHGCTQGLYVAKDHLRVVQSAPTEATP